MGPENLKNMVYCKRLTTVFTVILNTFQMNVQNKLNNNNE